MKTSQKVAIVLVVVYLMAWSVLTVTKAKFGDLVDDPEEQARLVRLYERDLQRKRSPFKPY